MRADRVQSRLALLAFLVFADLIWFAQTDKGHRSTDRTSAKYVVGLDTAGDHIASKEESAASNRHITMTNSSGHSFECIVPLTATETAEATEASSSRQQPEKLAASILESLSARCFYRVEDWWTYELCYQKHVRQFHREKDKLTAEYLLGLYNEEPEATGTLQGDTNDVSSSNYVKETYTGGDGCDLTGQTRQTEVRYVCSEGGQEAVLSIKEPSTCHYMLTVAVPGLCQLPDFRQQADPVKQIVCHQLGPPSAKDAGIDHPAHLQDDHHQDRSSSESELDAETNSTQISSDSNTKG